MSIDELLSVCSLLWPAVVIGFLWGHLWETERDRQRAVCRHTDVLTLRAGETFVGVIDGDEGYCTFIVHNATDGTNDA